jgi:hypothetical protein
MHINVPWEKMRGFFNVDCDVMLIVVTGLERIKIRPIAPVRESSLDFSVIRTARGAMELGVRILLRM